ncbi:MAG: ClpA/B family protein, partial [Myxococcaceae bacterium]|nr:ClpA/B family protein [Myxococcaceae bacterium]
PGMGFAGRRSDEEIIAEVDRRIAATFRPEFLNRFDGICHFRPLGRVEIRRIAQREVGRVLEREGIRARGLDVEVAPEVVDLLVEKGYSPAHGARYLQREIEKTLTSALAVEIARTPLPPGTPVKVVAHKGRVHAIAEPKAKNGKDGVAQVQLPAASGQLAKRKLDRGALISAAEALVGRAAAVGSAFGLPELEAHRRELLAASQAPGFWDDAERAAASLRGYRAIEAQLGELDRLREICSVARRRAREAKNDVQLAAAVQALEEAGREVQLAEARLASGTAGDVDEAWLDVSAASAGAAGEAWVGELVHLYLGWAQKRRYEAKVVAEGEAPSRAVLHLAGPGVFGFLSGEKGLHRRFEGDQRIGAYVRLFKPATPIEAGVEVEVREIKRHPGRFAEKLACEANARDEHKGRELKLTGTGERAEVERLVATLVDGQGEPGGEVRRYHLGRSPRVEDPRTGEATPRVKDVLRGEIDLFIAAWISRPPAETA